MHSAWTDRVDPDALLHEVHGYGAGESYHPAFAGAVGCAAVDSDHPGYRGDVYKHTTCGLLL
jgi:hypothetical protein